MSQNQARRGPTKGPLRGRGRRPPMSQGQPQQPQQQQNYGNNQQQQRGGNRNRGRGRGRGGGGNQGGYQQSQNYQQQSQNYTGYQQNQQQNVSQAPAVNQQQMGGGRKRKAPIKSQNDAMFAQFSAQPQQQVQPQPVQQPVQPQPVQQQPVVQQQREEEKQEIAQPTAGGPPQQKQNAPPQTQPQQAVKQSPKKLKPQQARNNRQPPWIEFTGGDKLAPKRCGWAHRVRQVLSADTLRVALLKQRGADTLLPPEIIQITLEGIQAPRTQKYDAEKAKLQAKDDKKQAKKDKKKQKQKERQKERQAEKTEKKETEKVEDKKDDKDKKDTKKGGDKGGKSPQKGKKGGKKEQTEQKEKDKSGKDKGDKSKPKRDKNKNNQQQRQPYQYQPLDEDEPFAYDAREFVRKKILNKNVFFAVWRVNSNQNNKNAPLRYWGDLYFQENNTTKSLTRELVSAGYASVKQNSGTLSNKEYESLRKKETAAKTDNKNIWSYDHDADINDKRVLNKIRMIKWIPYEGQKKFGDQYKNKELKGVVDQVISGSTLRVELKSGNSFSNVVVNIAGVNAPKVPPAQGWGKTNRNGRQWSENDKLNHKLSRGFGIKSREWTEERLLGQIVGVKILFVSNGQIIAQINHDKGRIGPSLLKKGLAQYESWSANLCDREEKQTLKSAADFAIKNNLQICNYIKSQGTRFNKFEKKVTVVQVISGDTVLVEEEVRADKGNKITTKQQRYTLSSIRAPTLRYRLPKDRNRNRNFNQGGAKPTPTAPKTPEKSGDDKKKKTRGGRKRGGNKGPSSPSKSSNQWDVIPDEYMARDAKEFVRKSCIGKQVTLRYEYSRFLDQNRNNQGRGNNNKDKKKEKKFATIFITNDKGKTENLALALIKRGLVDLIVHGKAETNRSEEYARLEDAWNNARAKKPHPPGIYQYLEKQKGGFIRPNHEKRKEEAKKIAIADYSGVDDAGIKTHDLIRLNQFLKGNRVKGVVEFVFGGNRVKIYIPQRKVCVAVRLADVRVGDWTLSGPKVGSIDPLRIQAKALLEKTILQRDIELEIVATGQEMNQQKGGRKKKGGGQGGNVQSRNPNLDGHIYLNGENISCELLKLGLATVIIRRNANDRTRTPANFKVLEKVARTNKIGFWKKYDEEGYGQDDAKNDEQTKQRQKTSKTGKEVEVVVSHIETASLFYVNDANSESMKQMNKDMEELKKSDPKPPKTVRPGKQVRYAAKYDHHYARCRVNNRFDDRRNQQNNDQDKGKGKGKGKNDDKDASQWYVFFVDYGNKARIARTNFVELPADLRIDKVPPLAMRCELAGISVFTKNQGCFNSAGYFFSDYAFGGGDKKLKMKILYDDQYSKTWYVDLYVGDKSINQLIAREGFVTLTKDRDLPRDFARQEEYGKAWPEEHKSYVKQYFDAIKENIRLAKDEHKNIWYHGDVDSDEDDNFPDNTGTKKGGKRGR